MSSAFYRGRQQVPDGPPPRSSLPPESKRVCAAEGCNTVLSAYNQADRCSAHQDEMIDIAALEGAPRRRSPRRQAARRSRQG